MNRITFRAEAVRIMLVLALRRLWLIGGTFSPYFRHFIKYHAKMDYHRYCSAFPNVYPKSMASVLRIYSLLHFCLPRLSDWILHAANTAYEIDVPIQTQFLMRDYAVIR
jgi:hypothetical protein